MALGAASMFNSDYGLAVTGYAATAPEKDVTKIQAAGRFQRFVKENADAVKSLIKDKISIEKISSLNEEQIKKAN